MAFRGLVRQPPKRMLIFFTVDRTTTVLETTKVKKVIEGEMLREGATVLVEFGKEDIEANVVKLHDDPGVLLEAETEFLTQMFGDVEEYDKENKPPNSPTARELSMASGKDKKVHNKAKKQRKRQITTDTQKPNAKKPKKIITIEAESMPDEPYGEDDENGRNGEPVKEPLSFLHVTEQEKVRKLVAQYQKTDEAEVGVQTDIPAKELCKDVGVQMNANEQPVCSCHDDLLLKKVTSLENKLDKLVSALGHSKKQECIDFSEEPISFDSFNEESDIMQTIAKVATMSSNDTLPGMLTTLEEETTENMMASLIPTPVSVTSPSLSAIPPTVYDDLFKRSSSVYNYAKNLVFEIFDKEELKNSNCSGTHEKQALERDPRMDLIKETTFKKFPMEDRRKTWAACRKAIESAIRKLRYKS